MNYKVIIMKLTYEQYLYEKTVLEAYGYTSITTYEEWKDIKNKKINTIYCHRIRYFRFL